MTGESYGEKYKEIQLILDDRDCYATFKWCINVELIGLGVVVK